MCAVPVSPRTGIARRIRAGQSARTAAPRFRDRDTHGPVHCPQPVAFNRRPGSRLPAVDAVVAGRGVGRKEDGRLKAQVEVGRLLIRLGDPFEFGLACRLVRLRAAAVDSVDSRTGLLSGEPTGAPRRREWLA